MKTARGALLSDERIIITKRHKRSGMFHLHETATTRGYVLQNVTVKPAGIVEVCSLRHYPPFTGGDPYHISVLPYHNHHFIAAEMAHIPEALLLRVYIQQSAAAT